MIFELWDTITRNMIGDFETGEAALEAVREAIADHGPEYVATLALVQEDVHGRSETLASGLGLVERAQSLTVSRT